MPMLGARQQRVAMGISEEVIRESRARLYPSITNPNWLVLRKRREIFKHWLRDLRVSPLRVLDVGGRLQPYRKLLADDVCYIAVDIRTTPLVDVVGRGEQLPFASGSFDLVLCTQVLQYVPEPSLILSEINRVLKPEGALMLSVPAAHVRDSEEECWRFLPAGLNKLLSSFTLIQVVPEGNTIIGFFRTVNVCLDIFARYAAARLIVRYTIVPLLNLAGLCLEHLARSENDQFAVNYSVMARKPQGGG
jgi:SAM-dependent methyltransferase